MKKVFCGFLILCFNLSASADDIQGFVGRYLKDFSLEQDLSQYFVEQPQFIFGSHLLVPESSDKAGEFMLGIRSKLKNSEYRESSIISSRAKANIDNYSLVTFHLQRYKADGEVLDEVCSTYGILQGETGYRITSWQPSEARGDGGCN
ncbi:hypothetical protein [Microbulbifer zhoushanensis]|uniref:hypothetical protein n=1 Tax=Microbulbifer TaxID=48073 RepID=UPI001F1D2CF2|nr:hypothetical protein [Microbulbifer zhoushanensis]